MITTLIKTAYKIISNHGIAEVWFNSINNNYSLHANAFYNEEDVIVDFMAATTQTHPTYLTIQTGINTHITLQPEFLQYVNHSCEPNVFFDTTLMQLICIKPIQPGDELCFFYPSTEWKMSQPFHCHCGAVNCLHLVNGAASLTKETISKYRLTDFILQLFKQKI